MSFDPAIETARYIDSIGIEALDRARDYTISSHWMIIWGLTVSLIVTFAIVRWGILDRLGQQLQHRSFSVRTFVVSAIFFLASAILTLPWTVYSGWLFEVSYGRTSQPVTDFLLQNTISSVFATGLGSAFFLLLYSLMRLAGARWWLWSGGLAGLAVSFILVISPIVIEPVFNEYRPLPEGPVRDALTQMAVEAGIEEDQLFVFNGSRQSNNFTANVSGVLGTGRIAISDVALRHGSLDEVRAVTGHEIGHYVYGHVWRIVLALTGLATLGFFLIDRLFPIFAKHFGTTARIEMAEGLPVLFFMFSAFSVLGQPLINAVSRQGEREADNYSLCMVQLPDALAGALIKTAEYRYPRPAPLQEVLFYTHPSVEWRVRNAMDWKAGRWTCSHIQSKRLEKTYERLQSRQQPRAS